MLQKVPTPCAELRHESGKILVNEFFPGFTQRIGPFCEGLRESIVHFDAFQMIGGCYLHFTLNVLERDHGKDGLGSRKI